MASAIYDTDFYNTDLYDHTSSSTNNPIAWMPRKVLGIDLGTCSGWAPSQGRECHNPVNRGDTNEATTLLYKMADHHPASSFVSEHLPELASLTLCVRYHRNGRHGQAEATVRKWKRNISTFVEEDRRNRQFQRQLRIAAGSATGREPQPASSTASSAWGLATPPATPYREPQPRPTAAAKGKSKETKTKTEGSSSLDVKSKSDFGFKNVKDTNPFDNLGGPSTAHAAPQTPQRSGLFTFGAVSTSPQDTPTQNAPDSTPTRVPAPSMFGTTGLGSSSSAPVSFFGQQTPRAAQPTLSTVCLTVAEIEPVLPDLPATEDQGQLSFSPVAVVAVSAPTASAVDKLLSPAFEGKDSKLAVASTSSSPGRRKTRHTPTTVTATERIEAAADTITASQAASAHGQSASQELKELPSPPKPEAMSASPVSVAAAHALTDSDTTQEPFETGCGCFGLFDVRLKARPQKAGDQTSQSWWRRLTGGREASPQSEKAAEKGTQSES